MVSRIIKGFMGMALSYLSFELVLSLFNIPHRLDTLIDRENLEAIYNARHNFFYGLTMPDDRLGFVVKPNFHTQVCFNSICSSISTDELGFRNSKTDKEYSKMVVLGDSFSFGYGVEANASWSRILEELVGLPLANLSIIAGSPWQYDVLLEDHPELFRDRLVIYGLFSNDFNDRKPENASDYYRRYGLDTYEKSSPTLADLMRIKQKDNFYERSATFCFFTALKPKEEKCFLKPKENDIDSEWLEHGGWYQLYDTFDTTIDRVSSLNSEMAVILFPSRASAFMEQYQQCYSDASTVKSEEEAYHKTAEFFLQRGIPVLDLTLPVRNFVQRGIELYYSTDAHFNDRGNLVAANELSCFLTNLHYVEPTKSTTEMCYSSTFNHSFEFWWGSTRNENSY